MKLRLNLAILSVLFFFSFSSRGQSWQELTSPDPATTIVDIYFADLTRGYAIDAANRVWLTVDAGNSWDIIFTAGVGLNAIEPAGNSVLWLMGDSGTLFRGVIQMNGNVNFAGINTTTGSDLNNAHFLNESTGWIVGDNGVIFITENGGMTLAQVFAPGNTTDFNDVIVQGSLGLIVTSGNAIVQSTNGGKTWFTGPFIPATDVRQIEFGNGSYFLLSPSSGFYRSFNGTTWNAVGIPPGEFNSFDIYNNSIVLTGNDGLTYESANSGATWDEIMGVPANVDLQSVSCVNNGCFTGGTLGKMYFYCSHITVGGRIWGDNTTNCQLDGSEYGYKGVNVVISNSSTAATFTTTTDATGYYEFHVKPGTYRISLPASNFNQGSVLHNLLPCGPGVDPNTDTPLDNNGDGVLGGPITTQNIDLSCGDEPGLLGVINTTVDIGLTFACAPGNHPLAMTSCPAGSASAVCNLNTIQQGCFSMPSVTGNQVVNCVSQQNVSNLSWFSFYAGTGNYTLNFELQGCYPGDNGCVGASLGIANACDPLSNSFCIENCGNTNVLSVPSSVLVPGKFYNIWLNGCAGSYCGYEFNIGGNYSPYEIPAPVSMTCDQDNCSQLCLNDVVTYTANDAGESYNDIEADFKWEVKSSTGTVVSTQVTSTNSFTYTFTQEGSFDICLVKVDHACDDKAFDFCTTVLVNYIADEDFGNVDVCENDLVFYQGPEFVDGIPGGISDPNGDGVNGWVQPSMIAFNPGQNIQTVTTPEGCVYTQTVNINIIFPSEIAEIDTVVCSSSEFPVYILDNNYFNATTDLFVVIPGAAQNGCDSLNSLTIDLIEVDGHIESMGCDSTGLKLEFIASTFQNTGFFPVQAIWYNQFGQEMAQDGDGDDFTITVPYADGSYTLEVEIDGVKRVCSWNFGFEVTIPVPVITAPDTLCTGDNGVFTFNFQGGNIGTPLWNLDGGNISGPIEIGVPFEVSWDTAGTKTIVLAGLENGCYVEKTHTVEVLPKLTSEEVGCQPGRGTVIFTIPENSYSSIVVVDVVSGHSGQLVGNGLLVQGLKGSEEVVISIQYASTICETYFVIARCTSLPCDTIDGLENFNTCAEAAGSDSCHPEEWATGCTTMSSEFTFDNLDIPCMVGDSFNMRWIPFTAGFGDYNIVIELDNCVGDGLNYAVFEGCQLEQPVVCNPDCSTTSVQISSDLLVPGQYYSILLSGCNGSICDYTFDVVGDFEAFSLPAQFDLLANNQILDTLFVCEDEDISATLTDAGDVLSQSGGLEFVWTLRDDINLTTDTVVTNQPVYEPVVGPGSYTLCLEEILHKCEAITPANACVQIEVLTIYEQVDISCEAGIDEIVFSWNTQAGHLNYNVSVLTGQNGVLNGNTFTVSNLDQGETVTIVLNTETLRGCEVLESTLTCTTIECPEILVLLNEGNPIQLCLSEDIGLYTIPVSVNPNTAGSGVFSGSGIIDGANGIFDPQVAGLGDHHIQYVFTTPEGCVYITGTTITVSEAVSASFTIDDQFICLDSLSVITFEGVVFASSSYDWSFDGALVIDGADTGPYTLSYDSVGIKYVSLSITDSLCGNAFFMDSIEVIDCSSCTCNNLIDTTVMCTAVFDPVCGCDGITYNNECEAQYYFGVKSWTAGPCNNTTVDTIRAFCDDMDPNTENDHINDECECVGDIIIGTKDVGDRIVYYPNPTSGLLYIEGIGQEEYSVYNSNGARVTLGRAVEGRIDLTLLPTGLYVVRIGQKNQIRIIKI